MIPNTVDTVEITSNMTDEAVPFSVDKNGLVKLMSVLTNLYSDPEGAVVREYLTNGLDSQTEALRTVPGYVWRPIEVTTPSAFTKEYKVRDFGLGMNANDITNTYSQYLTSTKESSQFETGMLGLGSKCALTYTSQFNIVGWKDGVKTSAIISQDSSGIPVFRIVDTRATDEPNGVEIAIPVRERNSFAEKTAHFLKFWKAGQVLVNGEEPVKHGWKEIKPGVFIIERPANSYRQESPKSYIVMGNVAYLIDNEFISQDLRNCYIGFAAYVEMGAVDFPPSREQLFYNNRTKAVIEKVSHGLFELLLKTKLDEITNAPDHRSAWHMYNALPFYFKNTNAAKTLAYKGVNFVNSVLHNCQYLYWNPQGHGKLTGAANIDLNNVYGRHAETVTNNIIFVTGVDDDTTVHASFKKKISYYMTKNGMSAGHAYLMDDDVDSVWLKQVPRVTADTIKAIKIPRAPSSGPRDAATYDVYSMDSDGCIRFNALTSVPVPTGKKLVYISPQDMKESYRMNGCSPTELGKILGKDYILVVLAKNRHDKFLRNHKASAVSNALQDVLDSHIAKITKVETTLAGMGYEEKRFFNAIQADSLKDPELRKLALAAQSHKGNGSNYDNAHSVYNFGRHLGLYLKMPDTKETLKLSENYPLINYGSRAPNAHIMLYCNAVYSAKS